MHVRWIGVLVMALPAAALAERPATKKVPVTDTYHGVKVTEDYRWLEADDDPAVKQWVAAQNALTRSYLDALPEAAPLRAAIERTLSARTSGYGDVAVRGGRTFAVKRQPPRQQPFIVVLTDLNDAATERVVVDPNVLDESGSTAIDWYVPSPDGELLAVSLSRAGTEMGDVHVFDVETGNVVHEVIPRVNSGTAGGDLAWAADGSGFYYTRHPRGEERPPEDMNFYQQLYFHRLGTSTEQDRYELGKDLPRIAEIQLESDLRTGRLLATVQKGDGGHFEHHLREADGTWRKFSEFGDKIVYAEFGPRDDLFVVSLAGAPRGKILRVPIDTLDVARARAVVPEGEDAIVAEFWHERTVLATATRLYVTYQLGGPSEIRVFDLHGRPRSAPQIAPVSAVGGLVRAGGDDVLFSVRSYVNPGTVYRFRPASNSTEPTALKNTSPVDLSDVRVVRERATSRDGTRVPVNILLPRGARRDGNNPCLLTGYGGYGISLAPSFRPLNRILLDHGVVVAVANLRGGGEFGEQWHRQGNLTNKQNVFDDFAAVLRHLTVRGYTTPARQAIIGGSNGGLLMGATLTQQPRLVRCAVSYVGIYDMLRSELSPNGEFNVTEFGTVKDQDQFRALYAYSPYHHVREGERYPPTLFLTGANDPRVLPMQSRKMTARLQAATPPSTPILLRTSLDSGHGGSTPLGERISQYVDVYAFLFHQLGIKPRQR